MLFLMRISILSLMLAPAHAFSADIEQGSKVYKKCIACHGKQGEGKLSQKAPKIGGQFEWYLSAQIKAIASKERSVPKMYPFVKALSDSDIANVSAYVAQLSGAK